MARKIFHYRVIRRFNSDCPIDKGRNVLRESNSSHEAREPGPHGISVKLAQQGCVVESDPSAAALFDVSLKGSHSRGSPRVGRIVELDEKFVLREECVVDFAGVVDVVDCEAIDAGLAGQPHLGSIDKGLVDAALLGDGHDLEPERRGLG